jgi:hypothetical protein
MPPTVNQEINVNINALVKGIQSVRELRDLIRNLRENRGSAPVVDERISKSARTGAGDVKQLQISIDELTRSIKEMDGQATSKLARLLSIFGSLATILGHLKSAQDGIGVIRDVAPSLSNVGQKVNGAAAAVRGFFTATRQKIGEGIGKAKETISGLVDKIPLLSRAGGQAAGAIGSIGVAGAGAAVGVGALAIALGAVLVAVLAIVGAVGILGFMFNLAKGAADAGSEIHDLSQELGLSAEIVSTLQVATRTTSTTFEEAARGVSKFNKLIGEAADGSKEAAKDLVRLGVEPQAALKDSEAALAAVFKRIHELPTPYEKARAAQIAFGKSGANMVPVIDAVGGSLEKAKEKAREFGKLLTDQAAKEADEFGDLIDELGLRVEGLGESIGRALIPELLKLLRIFDSEMPGAGGVFQLVLNQITIAVQDLVNKTILAIAAIKTLAALPSALGVLISTGNLDAAFGIITDRFKKEFSELLLIANTPHTGGGSTGQNFEFDPTGKQKKPGEPPSTFEAEIEFRKTKAQTEFNLEKDFLERIRAIYETALADRKIATEDYFDALEGFRRRELAAELKLNHQLQKIERDRRDAQIKEIDNDKDSTPAQKAAQKINVENRFNATIAPLEEEFERLTRAARDLPGEIETAETAALESLDRQISAFLQKVDEANGRTAAAAADAIDAEFRELLEKLTVERGENSPLVQLLKEFIQLQKDRARVKQIDEQLQPLGQQFEIDRLDVETRMSKELITQKQGRRELIELQRRYLQDQLAILKNELANTKEYRAQLEIKLRIANIENTLANLKEIDETARSINESLRFGLEDFFASLADGTKNLKQAFADLGLFILQMFARLAAQKFVESLFGDLLGDKQGQGGVGGVISGFFGLFGGKKAAGDMMNARPGGQLIQVAEAGFDELVVTTDPRYAARTSGLLTEFIRRTGILPNFQQFAAGGFARRLGQTFTTSIPRLAAGAFVPAAVPELAGAGGTVNLNEEHIHVWDPRHLHREMRGKAGQKTWFHNFLSNKTLIRRELGLT